MAVNGNQRNVRNRLVDGIQPDGGGKDSMFPGPPNNDLTRTARPARRQDGEDGKDLVSGRKFQEEQRG